MNLHKDNGATAVEHDLFAILKEGTGSERRFNFADKPRLLKIIAITDGSCLVRAVYGKGSSWVPKDRLLFV